MALDNLKQPPLNTTLMGVLRGVLDYLGVEVSTPMIFGGSGHAFLINIHEMLCPSGPYCWNPDPFVRLIANLGVERTGLGFFSPADGPEKRREVEGILKRHLDAGTACSLLNLENQLITGYDATGFLTAQPWAPNMNFPPGHLTFGTWEEFGNEFHVDFYTHGRIDPADEKKVVADSLEYAVDLWRNPKSYAHKSFGIGPDAYDNWIGAVKKGHGSSHGSWWNATVWAECRAMAAKYFGQIGEKFAHVTSRATTLVEIYEAVAEGLRKASDKEMGGEEKLRPLADIKEREEKTVRQVEELRAAL